MSNYISLQELNPCMRAAGIDQQADAIGPDRLIYDHEIIYCHRGSYQVYYDHHSCQAQAGDILIIPPKTKHRLDYRKAYEVYWVHLDFFYHNDQDNLARYIADDKNLALSPQGYSDVYARPDIIIKPNLRLPELYTVQNPARTYQLFQSLIRSFEERLLSWPLISKALLSELISETLLHLTEETLTNHDHSQLIQSVIEYLTENAHRKVTGTELANRFYYHQDTLNRHFKSELGLTIRDYQKQLKLDYIKQLLDETTLPLDQIAEQTQMTDRSHLIKTFTKALGMTPGEYRK